VDKFVLLFFYSMHPQEVQNIFKLVSQYVALQNFPPAHGNTRVPNSVILSLWICSKRRYSGKAAPMFNDSFGPLTTLGYQLEATNYGRRLRYLKDHLIPVSRFLEENLEEKPDSNGVKSEELKKSFNYR
jgi:hypothetical protein